MERAGQRQLKAEVGSARPAYDICDNSGDSLNFVPPKI